MPVMEKTVQHRADRGHMRCPRGSRRTPVLISNQGVRGSGWRLEEEASREGGMARVRDSVSRREEGENGT
jgi:hypothetical protein